MAEVDPAAFTNAFQRTVGFQRDLRDAEQRNALGKVQLERAQGVNALARNPNATAEQYIRAGDTATGAALANLPGVGLQQQATQQEIKQRALSNVAPIAAHAMTLDPQTRKSYLKNAIPVFAEDFKALGSNIDQGLAQLDSMPDQQLEQMLSQVAQFAPKPKDDGALVAYVDPTTGKPVYGTRSQAIGQRPYDKPPSIQIGAYRTLTPAEIKAAGLPDGTSAQINAEGKIDVLRSPNAADQKSIKDARAKLPRLAAAERRLERLNTALTDVAGNSMFDGGPLDAKALRYTKQGQEVVQAAAALLPELTALTRVPGIGSQSDLETRLSNLQLPSLEFSPEVNQRALQELKSYIQDLNDAYTSVTSDADGATPAAGQPSLPQQGASPPVSGPSGAPSIGAVEDGYRFKGGDPRDPRSWEQVR